MLSTFNKLSTKEQLLIQKKLNETNNIVEIISYCVMPTHLHLVLKQLIDGGISEYMKRVCDSYSKYFNLKYKRKGPLWEGRFKSVLVDDDKQLLHLTRYVHLNPISAGLVDDPMDWMASSYKEYINASRTEICNFNDLINISPNRYRRFVNERISYQRVIAHIKHIILE
ncbi:hypothetical protein A3F08_00270 [Candidatus Berkelbacteria bacterium RIFCSPHIGHO2_12_FULL_36_9]|uniref:Transposase IS200-like domain-containing protein n=1 Tax=Candidatus Berkelbacteria bacterium RIFCSPHIGHO2_12_FULL_36_9 TaxID=1797469 RepID=A0A1F5EDU4_9BACT|nr:MAG: hypothetical protein A3F08_00270 [Candidatus Berkelbacteria bacterium RIFCSPHIGHO2_12_FULL_36_9]